jgi:pimeloyl-ACP methyl ester carboxylesterase
VTLLVGERSELHDADHVVRRAEQHLPDVRTSVVPSAGHALPLSHVEEVQRAWIASRASQTAG